TDDPSPRKKSSRGKDRVRNYTFDLDNPTPEDLRHVALVLVNWANALETGSGDETPEDEAIVCTQRYAIVHLGRDLVKGSRRQKGIIFSSAHSRTEAIRT